MKTILALAGSSFMFLGLAVVASGQSYAIDWHTLDGGGTSAGGVYSVSGTIGQPDAGVRLTGGNYSLTGGFWSAEPTPGAPWLTIYLTNGNRVVLSWPSPATGFTLEQNANLSTANWVLPSEPIIDNGTIKFMIVNPPAGNRFYRLFKAENLD